MAVRESVQKAVREAVHDAVLHGATPGAAGGAAAGELKTAELQSREVAEHGQVLHGATVAQLGFDLKAAERETDFKKLSDAVPKVLHRGVGVLPGLYLRVGVAREGERLAVLYAVDLAVPHLSGLVAELLKEPLPVEPPIAWPGGWAGGQPVELVFQFDAQGSKAFAVSATPLRG